MTLIWASLLVAATLWRQVLLLNSEFFGSFVAFLLLLPLLKFAPRHGPLLGMRLSAALLSLALPVWFVSADMIHQQDLTAHNGPFYLLTTAFVVTLPALIAVPRLPVWLQGAVVAEALILIVLCRYSELCVALGLQMVIAVILAERQSTSVAPGRRLLIGAFLLMTVLPFMTGILADLLPEGTVVFGPHYAGEFRLALAQGFKLTAWLGMHQDLDSALPVQAQRALNSMVSTPGSGVFAMALVQGVLLTGALIGTLACGVLEAVHKTLGRDGDARRQQLALTLVLVTASAIMLTTAISPWQLSPLGFLLWASWLESVRSERV